MVSRRIRITAGSVAADAVLGKLAGGPTIFKKVRSGTQVKVERIQEA